MIRRIAERPLHLVAITPCHHIRGVAPARVDTNVMERRRTVALSQCDAAAGVSSLYECGNIRFAVDKPKRGTLPTVPSSVHEMQPPRLLGRYAV
jgi:hypothetical protein